MLWSSQPFLSDTLKWEAQHPEISFALRGISDEEMEMYETRFWEFPLDLPDWQRWLDESRELVALNRIKPHEIKKPRLDVKVRKWQQIHQLSVRLQQSDGPSFWVDWCGGKGHLLRSLVNGTNLEGVVIERDAELCASGLQLSRNSTLDKRMHFHCTDVVCDEVPRRYFNNAGVMALHACGQLTDMAITAGLNGGADTFVLVPCCYHKQPNDWHPVSSLGKELDVVLDKHALRLPSMLEQHLRPRRRDLRYRQLAYRIGFRTLYERCGASQPHLPSLPRRFFYLDFQEFCTAVSSRLEILLPPAADFKIAIATGWVKSRVARRLGLVHTPFRRALELWVNMDRALYLEAKGYDCQIVEFCEPSVTPRNMVIEATRTS